jgi:hypothetical protein
MRLLPLVLACSFVLSGCCTWLGATAGGRIAVNRSHERAQSPNPRLQQLKDDEAESDGTLIGGAIGLALDITVSVLALRQSLNAEH